MIDSKEISAVWLSDILQKIVTSVTRGKPFSSGQADWTPHEIQFEDNSIANILYKRFRPETLEWGRHELAFYQHCASKMDSSLFARCHHSGFDEKENIVWFLLENLNDTHRPHQEDALQLEIRQAVPALASLHGKWWEADILEHEVLSKARGGACRMSNACSAENIRIQAKHFLEYELPRSIDEVGETFTKGMAEICTRAIQAWTNLLIERIQNPSGLTVIQGDAHLDNMFFPQDDSTHGAKFVDWETWERGIPAYDLAYMLTFSSDMEDEVMASYFDGLVGEGVGSYSHESFLNDYRLFVLGCLFPPIV